MNWKLAAYNLSRNWRRTLATGSAVLAGFVGLSLVGGYMIYVLGAQRVIAVYLHHAGHLSFFHKGGVEQFLHHPKEYQVTGEEQTQIAGLLQKHSAEIEFVSQNLSGFGLISNGKKTLPFAATSIDPAVEDRIRTHPEVLRFAKEYFPPSKIKFKSEYDRSSAFVSVTSGLAELLDIHKNASDLSDEEGALQIAVKTYDGDLNAMDVQLRANHSTGIRLLEDTSLMVPLKTLQDLYRADGVQSVTVYLKDWHQTQKLQHEWQKELQEKGSNLELHSFMEEAIAPEYVGTISFLATIAGFFLFLILGTVSLSVVNSLTMGILERVRELGTMRALGYSPLSISILFVQESLVLSSVCIALGYVVSYGVIGLINGAHFKMRPPGYVGEVDFLLFFDQGWNAIITLLLLVTAMVTGFLTTYFKLKAKVVDLLYGSGA